MHVVFLSLSLAFSLSSTLSLSHECTQFLVAVISIWKHLTLALMKACMPTCSISPSLSLSRYSQSEHALSLFSVALALCALSFTFTLATTRSLPLLKSIVMLYTLQSIPFKVIFSKTLSKTPKLELLFCNILVMY